MKTRPEGYTYISLMSSLFIHCLDVCRPFQFLVSLSYSLFLFLHCCCHICLTFFVSIRRLLDVHVFVIVLHVIISGSCRGRSIIASKLLVSFSLLFDVHNILFNIDFRQYVFCLMMTTISDKRSYPYNVRLL
jgi:hypothetical protein